MRLTGTPLLLATSACLTAALVCHVIAMVTSYWLQSASAGDGTFLNIGLWAACFNNYEHKHEHGSRHYDGCHLLYSEHYVTIRDWLIPYWLVVCRVTSVVAMVFLIIAAILFIVVMLCVICQMFSCDNFCLGRTFLYATPIASVLASMFLLITLTVFADNAFRLQCKDYWVSGNDPNKNHLGFSWGFELAACLLSLTSTSFIVWLVVLKKRDDI